MLGAGAPQPAYDRNAPQLAVKAQQPEAASAEEQETSRKEIAGGRRTPSQGEDEDEEEDKDEDEDEDGEILLVPDADVFEFHVGYHGEQCPETATFQVADERLARCLECGKFIKTARSDAPAAGKKAATNERSFSACRSCASTTNSGSATIPGLRTQYGSTMTVGSMTFSTMSIEVY